MSTAWRRGARLLLLSLFSVSLSTTQAGNDYASRLALDPWENVLVTGSSEGVATALDFATLKYDANGSSLWRRRYNGPSSGNDTPYFLAVDGPGNVYVTGASRGNATGLDYATIKMDSSGNVKWTARFNGLGNGDDIPRGITVDSVGNVYVTGSSFSGIGGLDIVTIKYDTNGARVWAVRWSGPAGEDVGRFLQVDGSGNVYVSGSSASVFGLDYITLKYDANGVLKWATRYNGPGNRDDIPSGLVIDMVGNAFVTGTSVGFGTGNDYATIKYDTNGVQKWVQRFNGPVNGNDQANAIAFDNCGNIVVTGGSYGLGGGVFDFLTIKYDGNGAILWTQRFNGPVSGEDIATALAVDTWGNIFVTGSSLGLNSARDYLTIKYNKDGALQWFQRFNGTGNGDDTPVGIVLNNSTGNVYVTGTSLGRLGTGPDYATVKYNKDGAPQWVRTFDGP